MSMPTVRGKSKWMLARDALVFKRCPECLGMGYYYKYPDPNSSCGEAYDCPACKGTGEAHREAEPSKG